MSLNRLPDTSAGLAGAIRTGTGHDQVRAEVVGILRATAAGSREQSVVVHPLGFLCLPIHRSDDYGLCVHVWAEGVPRAKLTTTPIHYHTWNLFSHVLFGSIQNQRIAITSASTGPAFRIFEVRSSPDVDEIAPTEEIVSWTVTGSRQYGIGDRYLVPPRDYHRSVALDHRLTVTVMLSENWTPEPQRTLGDVHLGRHVVRRSACPPSVAGKVVDKLLEHLDG